MNTNFLSFWLLALGTGTAFLMTPPAWAENGAAPSLELRAELTWETPYAGDPLRVRVFLRSPRGQDEAYDQLLQIERGEAPPANGFPANTRVPEGWDERVTLRLSRLEAGGSQTEVLAPGPWAEFLRPQVGRVPSGLMPTLVRSREWLVPAEVAHLTPGDYLLEVNWRGQDLAPPDQLPADGLLPAAPVRFTVVEPGGATPQAEHLGRLAFTAYMRKQNSEARRRAEESIAMDPLNRQRDRLETRFIVANSAMNLSDALGAAAAYEQVLQLLGPEAGGEIAERAQAQRSLLAPSLRILSPPSFNTPLRLEIRTLPAQRYLTYRSADLKSWMPLSTNLSLTNWVVVLDEHPYGTEPRFYRSVLQP